jgi:hypothetical protein
VRKVTKQAIYHFDKCENFKLSNTEVLVEFHVNGFDVHLLLHGNLIATKKVNVATQENTLFITNAGWQSNTTKERLNGLNGVGIYQKKGQWYLNGKAWDGEWVNVGKWNSELEETDFVKNS